LIEFVLNGFRGAGDFLDERPVPFLIVGDGRMHVPALEHICHARSLNQRARKARSNARRETSGSLHRTGNELLQLFEVVVHRPASIRKPHGRSRMVCEQVGSASVRANLAVQFRELRCVPEPLFDRRGPEQHDYPWRDEIDLPLEPVLPAHSQFIVAWRAILRRPALHAVCQEDLSARQSHPAQHVVEELAGAAHKWTTFDVFCTAGRFTDEHHRWQ
jgi:hypothetical protein